MGAWGYKTFDNDNASDWLFAFEKSLTKSIKSDCYDENLAAIHILTSLQMKDEVIVNSFPNFDIVDLAFNRIEKILEDKDWLYSWNDKNFKIKEINKLKNKLKIMRNKLVANEIAK